MQRMISYYFGRDGYSRLLMELTDQKFNHDLSGDLERDGILSGKDGSQAEIGHIDVGSNYLYVHSKDGMNKVDVDERSRLLKLLDDFSLESVKP
jgi:hypothetical protein